MRRLKSVALTIPCVVGPYTGVNCTLTLLRSEIRKSALVSGGYRRTDDQDAIDRDQPGAERHGNVRAQLPRRTLPALRRRRRSFDLAHRAAERIPAVRLRHHRRCGAAPEVHVARRRRAAQPCCDQGVEGCYQGPRWLRLFSLRQEYASGWYRFLDAPPAGPGDQSLTISLAKDRFPFAFQARKIGIETISVFIKVHPEFAATHNEGTLKITLEPGAVATPGAAPIALTSWNGLLRAEVTAATDPGDWTMTAWLAPAGGARTRLSPGALEDVALVCACTCT
jgi:hypothetical protein